MVDLYFRCGECDCVFLCHDRCQKYSIQTEIAYGRKVYCKPCFKLMMQGKLNNMVTADQY